MPRTLIYEVLRPDAELVVEVERNPEGNPFGYILLDQKTLDHFVAKKKH